MMMIRILALIPLLALALPAHAQEANGDDDAPRRYRIAIGPQVTPRFPGADDVVFSPYFDLGITRGDKPFAFEAADESFSIPIIDDSGFQMGPAASFEGPRRREKVGAAIDEVGTTVELGGYAQGWLAKGLRLHGEVRQGVNGHRGLVGYAGLDFVARSGDKWLFALGPRVSFSNGKYRRAYFEVTPAVAARTGLPVYQADGSAIHALGATITTSYQLTPRWGLAGYVKYDRLTGDGADSPITKTLGSPNQLSGGLALSFTFGKGVR